MTFLELYNSYLLECKANLKVSSVNKIKNIVELHILPYLKNEILPLTVDKINSWKILIKNKNLSDTYIRSIYTYLSCIFNFGYRVYNIENTLHRTKNFKRTKPEFVPKIYTLEQFKKYLSVITNLEERIFFSILFFCGLRKGELLALKWTDFLDNYLVINKTFSKGKEGSPKTISSNRIIYLPTKIIEDLTLLKNKVKKVRTRIFNFKETTIDRHNRKYALLAGLPRIRIHDFRHSNITYLTYKKFTPMEICERTGHKDKTIIVNKYSHLINTYQKQIVDCIDKDFK